MQAYASLGGQDAGKGQLKELGGSLLEAEPVADAAARHGKTTAQVLLRWAVQKGIAVIPKSRSASRMASNHALLDWVLSPDDMAAIDAMDRPSAEEGRLCWKRDPLRFLDFE